MHAASLRIGITNTYAPYHFIGSDGKPAGIHYEIIREAFKDLGLDVKLVVVPRKRLEEGVVKGEIDAFLNALEWTEGAERFVYSQPLSIIRDVLFSREKNLIRFEKPEDLTGRTVIAIRGYHYPSLDRQFADGRTIRYDVKDELHALKMLDAERGDAALIVDAVGDWIVKQEKFKNGFAKSTESVTRAEIRLMLAKSWHPALLVFNQGLERMKQSGALDAIYSRYQMIPLAGGR